MSMWFWCEYLRKWVEEDRILILKKTSIVSLPNFVIERRFLSTPLPLSSQSSDAIGQRGGGSAPQGGRGGGKGAPTSSAPLAPLQPPVRQPKEQVLQWAHTPAKWAHVQTYTYNTHITYIKHTHKDKANTSIMHVISMQWTRMPHKSCDIGDTKSVESVADLITLSYHINLSSHFQFSFVVSFLYFVLCSHFFMWPLYSALQDHKLNRKSHLTVTFCFQDLKISAIC